MLTSHLTQARLHALLLVPSLLAGVVWAAPPDAGSLLQNVQPAPGLPARSGNVLPETPERPAMKLDSHIRIAVKLIRITGNKAFSEAELLPLVQDALGHELSLAGLQAYAERITGYYRKAGFLLARAYLPAQDIKDGVVEIAVLEGRLGKLRIENGARLVDASVRAHLAGLQPGQPVDGALLERSLLLMNDLPGVDAKSTLKPGQSVGSSDLDVQVSATPLYTGDVELDNYGNRYTGENRLGASLSGGNLTGWGDSLALKALTSSGMDYGRMGWQIPVGANGTQAGAAYSQMRYRLGKDFAALQSHGKAGIASLYLFHPLIRSRITNLYGRLGYDRKRLDDFMDATASASHKTLDVWSANLYGERVDSFSGGALTQWSLGLSTGRLHLDAATAALDALGYRTQGSYSKGTYSLSRLQRLSEHFNFYASIQGQQAGKNLDSSEKMSLGGAQSVRAYPQGEAPSDDAWLASLEVRYGFAPDW